MPRLRLLLPPLSRLLQLPSHGGFIVGAEPHAGCAKKVPKLSFTTISANICNPCFSTYPGATSHDMWYNTIILGIYTVCFTKIFSSGTAKTHFICSGLLLGWCFSFCNVFRSGFLAMELRNRMSSWVSWDSFNSTNTHHYIYIYILIHLRKILFRFI